MTIMSRTLHLVMTKDWYNLVESGQKTEEYRKFIPFYWKRLFKKSRLWDEKSIRVYYETHGELPKEFDTVTFHYGYSKKFMVYELKKIRLGHDGPAEWGCPQDEDVFMIGLGKRIE